MIYSSESSIFQESGFRHKISGIDGSGKGYITEKLVNEVNNQGIHGISINIMIYLFGLNVLLPPLYKEH
ncbi:MULTISPECIES: hypothetical protein [unclassified Anabaena]|uniref:hypothetical protein n=1 Tax=unclassified Anabaena TaxID=2619674 RepID=UPI001446A245|nr:MULTISPECIES: hypothetical protein [unclassified Anabaena]MTJ06205.1 hypothetical protein [Anabaena sp. UHCC 0204]MTJ54706.1 hypothetical protein [Anabaena sp. UHCC 0253]